jgi:hypothetical protein
MLICFFETHTLLKFTHRSIHQQAKVFRETIAFGETVVACRRVQTTISSLAGFR